MNENIKWVYDELKKIDKDYDLGDYEEFDSIMNADGESRKWVYEQLQNNGYDIGDTYEEFESYIVPKSLSSLWEGDAPGAINDNVANISPKASQQANPSQPTPQPQVVEQAKATNQAQASGKVTETPTAPTAPKVDAKDATTPSGTPTATPQVESTTEQVVEKQPKEGLTENESQEQASEEAKGYTYDDWREDLRKIVGEKVDDETIAQRKGSYGIVAPQELSMPLGSPYDADLADIAERIIWNKATKGKELTPEEKRAKEIELNKMSYAEIASLIGEDGVEEINNARNQFLKQEADERKAYESLLGSIKYKSPKTGETNFEILQEQIGGNTPKEMAEILTAAVSGDKDLAKYLYNEGALMEFAMAKNLGMDYLYGKDGMQKFLNAPAEMTKGMAEYAYIWRTIYGSGLMRKKLNLPKGAEELYVNTLRDVYAKGELGTEVGDARMDNARMALEQWEQIRGMFSDEEIAKVLEDTNKALGPYQAFRSLEDALFRETTYEVEGSPKGRLLQNFEKFAERRQRVETNQDKITELEQRRDDLIKEGMAEYDRQFKANPILMSIIGGEDPYMQFQAIQSGNGKYGKELELNDGAITMRKKAQDIINHGESNDSFVKGVVSGFIDKAKYGSNWDFGLSDFMEALEIKNIVERVDKGIAISKDEEDYLDAFMTLLATQAMVEQGRGYKAGGVTAQAIPFMIEMMLPIKGGRSAASAFARWAIKKYGATAVRKAPMQVARYAIRGAGDVAKGIAMAVGPGALKTAKKAIDFNRGELIPTLNEEGDITYGGRKEGDDLATAIYKGVASNTIEYYSELLGAYFGPFLKGVGKLGSDGVSKIGLGAVNDFFTNVNKSDWGKLVKEFMDRANWHGTPAEFAEEIAGGILNSIFVGEQTLDTGEKGVFNTDNLIDTYLGVAVMGTMMQATQALGYKTEGARLRKERESNSRIGERLMGAGWEDVKATIDASTSGDISAIVADYVRSNNYNAAQKKAILEYAKSVVTDNQMMDKEESQELEYRSERVIDAQSAVEDRGIEGFETIDGDGRRKIELAKEQADMEIMAVMGVGSVELAESELAKRYGATSAQDIVTRASEDESLTREQRNAIIDYMGARTAKEGMAERKNVDIENRINELQADVDAVTNKQSGMLVGATLKSGEQVWVVNGSVMANEDGTIDVDNTDESLAVVDQAGEVFMISPSDISKTYINTPEAVMGDSYGRIRSQMEEEYDQAVSGKRQLRVGEKVKLEASNTEWEITGIAPDAEGTQLVALQDNGGGTIVLPLQEVYVRMDEALSAQLPKPIEGITPIGAEQAPSEVTPTTEKPKESPVEIEVTQATTEGIKINDEVSFEVDGNELRGIVVEEPDADGVTIEAEDGSIHKVKAESIKGKVEDAPSMVEETETIPIAQGDNNVEPTTDATNEGSGQEILDNSNEVGTTTPTAETPTQSTSLTEIPTDEKGKKQYEQASVEDTINDIYNDPELDEEDADAYVQARIDGASKRIAQLEKKKPKMGEDIPGFKAERAKWREQLEAQQASLAYWQGVQEAVPEVRRRERARQQMEADLAEQERARQARAEQALRAEERGRNRGDYRKAMAQWDDTPGSFYEYVAQELLAGDYKMRWDDNGSTRGLGSHTTGRRGVNRRGEVKTSRGEEFNALRWLIDNNNGISPEALADRLWNNYTDSYGEDMAEGNPLDVLLDVVTSMPKPQMMWDYVKGEHDARMEAEQGIEEQFAEVEIEAMERDAMYREKYGVSEDEYWANEAQWDEFIESRDMSAEELGNYDNFVAEQIIEENERRNQENAEDEQRSNNNESERGTDVLSGTQSDNTRGNGDVTGESEGIDGSSVEQDDVAQEEARLSEEDRQAIENMPIPMLKQQIKETTTTLINISQLSSEWQEKNRDNIERAKLILAYAKEELARKEGLKKSNKWGIKIGNSATPFSVVRKMFGEFNSNEDIAQLFDKVAKVFESLPIKIVFSDTIGSKGTQGWFSPTTATLKLPGHFVYGGRSLKQSKAETILHEMIHAVTTYALYINEKPHLQTVLGFRLSDDMHAAIRQLKRIYASIASDKDFKGEYGATSVHEMVAELSNVQFRDKLKKKNLWETIVDAIKQLFGIKPSNALEGAEVALEYMLNNFDRSQWDKMANMRGKRNKQLMIGNTTGLVDTPASRSLEVEDRTMLNRLAKALGVEIEVADIIAKANADGTYMKAPNGKPTNLTEEQWADVRTKAFKEWFGDWELVANIKSGLNALLRLAEGEESIPNAMRRDELRMLGGTAEITFDWGIYGKLDKSGTPRGGFGFAKIIQKHGYDEAFRIVETIAKGEIGTPYGVEGGTRVDIVNGDYQTTISLYRNGKSESWVLTGYKIDHNTDAKGRGNDLSKATQTYPIPTREDLGAALKSDTNIQYFNEITNISSKIVDENGEPMVVYHQTNRTIYRNVETGENWDDLDWREKEEWEERDDWEEYWQEEDFYGFSRTNARTTNEFDGFFFAPKYDEYHEYGDRTIEAFLNIRKPASREDYHIDAQYNDAGRKERIRLQEEGYDGVIREEDGVVDEYVVFEPNQIKSATDNVGTYSSEDNDIRYSLRSQDARKVATDAVVEMLGNSGIEVVRVSDAEVEAMLNTESLDEVEFRLMDIFRPKTTVYHGSGAEFDRFDHSRMGEGEGVQAFGWGTYVTESEGIGRYYAKASTNGFSHPFMKGMSDMLRREVAEGKSFEEAKNDALKSVIAATKLAKIALGDKFLEKGLEEEFNRLKAMQSIEDLPSNYLYTVKIPKDNGSNYLHYDDAVPYSIIKKVKSKLADILKEEFGPNAKKDLDKVFVKGLTGKEVYTYVKNALESEKQASIFFSQIGVVGMQYSANYLQGGNAEGQSNYVIFNETDAKIADRVEFLKTPQGEVYGWTDGKKVYLTEKGMNPETPIHEYTHIWARAMKNGNAKGWQSVKDLLRDTPIWNEVMNDANYADIRENEDAVASEALSRISGKENAKRMESEAQRMIDEANGVFAKAEAITLIERMRKALKEFWSWVGKNLFDIKEFGSIEEVTDRVLYDLVNNTELGVNESVMEGQPMFRPISPKRTNGYTEEEVSMANDPIAKVMGKSGRTKAQQAKFAERERKAMRNKIKELTERMGIGDRIEVIGDAEIGVQSAELSSRKARAKGWFELKTGKIVINLNNHLSVADVERTLLHEAVAHYGLRELFGEQFDAFLDNVYNFAEGDIKSQIDALANSKGLSTRVATEEYLAGLAEDTNFEYLENQTSFWRKLKRAFMDMLESIGWSYKGPELSDNELRYILWRSWENMVTPGRHRSILGMAEDVVKREKFGIGIHRASMSESQVAEAEEMYNDGAVPTLAEAITDYKNLFTGAKELNIISFDSEQDIIDFTFAENGTMKEAQYIIDRIKNANSVGQFYPGTNMICIFAINPVNGNPFASLFHEHVHYAIDQLGGERKMKALVGELRDIDEELAERLDKDAIYAQDADNEMIAYSLEAALMGNAIEELKEALSPNAKKELEQILNKVGYEKGRDYEQAISKHERSERSGSIKSRTKRKIAQRDQRRVGLGDGANGGEKGDQRVVAQTSRAKEKSVDSDDSNLYRDSDEVEVSKPDKVLARDAYERMVSSGRYQFVEAVQDSMMGLKLLYKSILGKGMRIEEVSDFENAYLAENAMSSRNAAEQYEYSVRYMKPLLKAVHALAGANAKRRQELTDYMLAKHGLERNRVMAEREAQKTTNEAVKAIEKLLKKEREKIEKSNELFKIQLQDFANNVHEGNLRIGEPSAILEACGLDVASVFIAPTTLNTLLSERGLSLEDIKELPNALGSPLMVYETKNDGPMVAIVMVPGVEQLLTLAVKLETKGKRAEVTDVESIGQDVSQYVSEMVKSRRGGLRSGLRYVFEGSAQGWAASYIETLPQEQKEEVVALIDGFENPTTSIQELQEALALEKAKYDGVAKNLPAEDAQKWYDARVKTLDSLFNNGNISSIEYSERLVKLNVMYNGGYVALNRERDYSGLTALTKTSKVAEAEAIATQMVNAYEATNNGNAIDELWKRINDATHASLEKTYKGGLLSKAQYEDILGMYEHYIPLRGWEETTSDEVYAYFTTRSGVSGSVIKKAEGRKSKADDPIAFIGMMADDAIRQSNRNSMKQKFLNFVMNHPSDLVSKQDLWLQYDEAQDEWVPVFAKLDAKDSADEVAKKIEEFEAKMESLAEQQPDKYKRGADAVNIPYRVVPGNEREHQVIVKRGGRTYVLTINGNPRAAQALNGLTNPDVNTEGVIGNILSGAEWVNRQLSAFYTTRNPDFVVSNYFRDMIYSNSMTWVKESPAYAWRFNFNCGKFNPGTMRWLMGKWVNGTLNRNDKIENLFYEFMMNGGETGYTEVHNLEKHKKIVSDELKTQSNKVKAGWKMLGMQLDELNRSVENVARFSAFVTSREMGRSITRSIYDAKEVSVNFNKKGSGGKMVNAIGQTRLGKVGSYVSGVGRLGYVFWNAGVQGMTNYGRNLKRYPKKTLGSMAIIYLLGSLVPYLGDDDDDTYYDLAEYIRRSNICIKVGDQWLTIPLPIEFRAMYGLGELYTGVIRGKEKYTDEELAYQIASQVSQVLPLDMLEGGGGVNPFIPSLAKPTVEAELNRGWHGMPIYKEFMGDKEEFAPGWTRAYKNTSSSLVELSKLLNELSGGDNLTETKGSVGINPGKVEYILKGMFGGIYSTANRLVKMSETAFGDREFDWSNMIIANRLIKSGDERTEKRKLQKEYYDYLEQYKRYNYERRNAERKEEHGILGAAEKANELYNNPDTLTYFLIDGYKDAIDFYRNEAKELPNEDEKKAMEDTMYMYMKEVVDSIHAVENSKR